METKPLLRDELTDKLRDFALSNRSNIPIKLLSERALAEKLKVSRISLRQAIKNLAVEGILEQKQGSGTYIIPLLQVQSIQVLLAEDIKIHDPFFSKFLMEITKYCSANMIHLHFIQESNNPEPLIETEPLILLGLMKESTIEAIMERSGITISTQFYPDFLNITQLLFDDYKIGWEAANMLAQKGHARVVALAGPQSFASSTERLKGFEYGAKKNNLAISRFSGKMNWKSGYLLADKVVELLGKPNAPTAAFAANDWMALGLMQKLAELGIKIPDQMAVIGCDDIEMAEEVSPSLSTFRWDIPFTVTEIFNVINYEIRNSSQIHRRIILSAQFIAREST